jgi:hypothetical protein
MGWMKNSAGKPDAMLTMAFASFWLCAFAMLAPVLDGLQIPFTTYSIELGTPSSELVIAFLGATFTSYVVRRNKKDQVESDEVREQLRNGIVR